jgi:hypothetical protein
MILVTLPTDTPFLMLADSRICLLLILCCLAPPRRSVGVQTLNVLNSDLAAAAECCHSDYVVLIQLYKNLSPQPRHNEEDGVRDTENRPGSKRKIDSSSRHHQWRYCIRCYAPWAWGKIQGRVILAPPHIHFDKHYNNDMLTRLDGTSCIYMTLLGSG